MSGLDVHEKRVRRKNNSNKNKSNKENKKSIYSVLIWWSSYGFSTEHRCWLTAILVLRMTVVELGGDHSDGRTKEEWLVEPGLNNAPVLVIRIPAMISLSVRL